MVGRIFFLFIAAILIAETLSAQLPIEGKKASPKRPGRKPASIDLLEFDSSYPANDALGKAKNEIERAFGIFSLRADRRERRERLVIQQNRAELWYWKVLGSELGELPLKCQALGWMLEGRYIVGNSTQSPPPARVLFSRFPAVTSLTLVLYDNLFGAAHLSTERGDPRVRARAINRTVPYMKLTMSRAIGLALNREQVERELRNMTSARCDAVMGQFIQGIEIDPRVE